MTANELRIGNWILADVGIPSMVDHQIRLRDFGEWNKYKMEGRIKPIPLTEEWLERLGFSKWKRGKVWSAKRVMIYFNLKDGFCYGKASMRTKIEHVHQLQNLYFALTGQELEIKQEA